MHKNGPGADVHCYALLVGGPDTSMEYIRRVLVKPYPLGVTTNNVGGGGVPMSAPAAAAAAAVKAATAVKAAACSGLLAEPLDAKLPVLGALVQGALLGDSRLGEYVTVETGDGLAAWAHKLRLTTTAALSGMHLFISDKLGGSKTMTTVKMALLVDATLSLALENLGLYTSMDRAAADESYGAAGGCVGGWVVGWVGAGRGWGGCGSYFALVCLACSACDNMYGARGSAVRWIACRAAASPRLPLVGGQRSAVQGRGTRLRHAGTNRQVVCIRLLL